MLSKVNYNKISESYDNRYLTSPLEGVQSELQKLIDRFNPKLILEIGSGTGHWMSKINGEGRSVLGVDYSTGMLLEAKRNHHIQNLMCADAQLLPIKEKTLDFIYCINAIHHFTNPYGFMVNAKYTLRPGGVFTIMGLDPAEPANEWFLWKYFPGTYEYDLNRYTSFEKLEDQMTEIGFQDIIIKDVHRVSYTMINEEVLNDNFIEKSQSSQLTVLSYSEYEAGIKMIHDEIAYAKSEGIKLAFKVNLLFKSITATAS
ncbi:class I SAM-dependent methyltransferase [Bacteroidota bacterium]